MAQASLASRMADRLERRRDEHLRRGRVYRAAWVIGGLIITLAGVAMLLLPGPALVVIPIGLAMLALEFAWAERALHHALRRADQAQQTASKASPVQKALTGLACLLAAIAFVVVAILYDIPVLPV